MTKQKKHNPILIGLGIIMTGLVAAVLIGSLIGPETVKECPKERKEEISRLKSELETTESQSNKLKEKEGVIKGLKEKIDKKEEAIKQKDKKLTDYQDLKKVDDKLIGLCGKALLTTANMFDAASRGDLQAINKGSRKLEGMESEMDTWQNRRTEILKKLK